jgi:hypothetical protein
MKAWRGMLARDTSHFINLHWLTNIPEAGTPHVAVIPI